MLDLFTIENKSGEKFLVACKQCPVCLELKIYTQAKEEAGFLRFVYQKEAGSVKILDIQIHEGFSSKGLGPQMFRRLFVLFAEQGFSSIVGSCKSSRHPLSEKEKLATWYERLGFVLTRKSMENIPGYLGELYKKL